MYNGTKDISPILKEILSSEEMAACLAAHTLTRTKMRTAVAYAPIPLERKRDMFLQLATGKDTAITTARQAQSRGPSEKRGQDPENFLPLNCQVKCNSLY